MVLRVHRSQLASLAPPAASPRPRRSRLICRAAASAKFRPCIDIHKVQSRVTALHVYVAPSRLHLMPLLGACASCANMNCRSHRAPSSRSWAQRFPTSTATGLCIVSHTPQLAAPAAIVVKLTGLERHKLPGMRFIMRLHIFPRYLSVCAVQLHAL